MVKHIFRYKFLDILDKDSFLHGSLPHKKAFFLPQDLLNHPYLKELLHQQDQLYKQYRIIDP